MQATIHHLPDRNPGPPSVSLREIRSVAARMVDSGVTEDWGKACLFARGILRIRAEEEACPYVPGVVLDFGRAS